MAARVSLIPVIFSDRGDFCSVYCAVNYCRNTLNVSHEDAKAGSVPMVEGWRTDRVRGVGLVAYCGRCADEQLTPEGF